MELGSWPQLPLTIPARVSSSFLGLELSQGLPFLDHIQDHYALQFKVGFFVFFFPPSPASVWSILLPSKT